MVLAAAGAIPVGPACDAGGANSATLAGQVVCNACRSAGPQRGSGGPVVLRQLALAAMLGALAVTVSGCSRSGSPGHGWPEGITPEATSIEN